MENNIKALLKENRAKYGISIEEVSDKEIMEYLKYVEINELKEQNEHLKDLKAVVASMAGIALLFIAISFFVCVIIFRKENPSVRFISLGLTLVFFLLSMWMFAHKN